jgi:type II secretory ATPase GspE/PulE/Tfp pilus assembly ATPase PilB-like protein
VDLKVEPYMIAATVEGVLAQRLVRRICTECRERYRPDPAAAAILAGRPLGELILERGRGCANCRQTGYRGRTGLFELLTMTDDLRHELLSTLDLGALRRRVHDQGMVTLRQDAWAKVQAGLTTVEEVLRVVQD